MAEGVKMKEESKKKFSLIVGIILVVVVCVGGYFVFNLNEDVQKPYINVSENPHAIIIQNSTCFFNGINLTIKVNESEGIDGFKFSLQTNSPSSPIGQIIDVGHLKNGEIVEYSLLDKDFLNGINTSVVEFSVQVDRGYTIDYLRSQIPYHGKIIHCDYS